MAHTLPSPLRLRTVTHNFTRYIFGYSVSLNHDETDVSFPVSAGTSDYIEVYEVKGAQNTFIVLAYSECYGYAGIEVFTLNGVNAYEIKGDVFLQGEEAIRTLNLSPLNMAKELATNYLYP